jgi:beta-glucosidase
MNREGEVTVSVVLARKGGLYAEYFNNAFLDGIPALTRVDNIMNFNWTDGIITEESGDYVSIHWYGKLLAPTTEDFIFILRGDDGFRFFLEGNLLIDRWNSCCDEMTVTVPLIGGLFYDIVLQYREF